jgi:hypothetical protein
MFAQTSSTKGVQCKIKNVQFSLHASGEMQEKSAVA